MIRTKLGIKVLGLCALVFALMGIASSGAQGAASWLVLEPTGGTVTEGVGGEVILETDSPTLVLHSHLSGNKAFLVTCTGITAVGIKLAAAGTIANGSKIKFSGCKTEVEGVLLGACEPTNAGTEKGVILTKGGHAALVLHELSPTSKDELGLILPDEVGGPFAVIEMSKECSIGTKVPVGGKFVVKDCKNLLLTHSEKHLIEEGPLTHLWVISDTVEHAASILGSVWVKVKTGGVFREFAGHAG